MIRKILLLVGFSLPQLFTLGQIVYPFPEKKFPLTVENKQCYMSYMDIAPATSNGRTILLLHGKNFNGFYWKEVIPDLVKRGFRVVVPDQLGWGHSDKPDLHYSFHMLATNNKILLDSLGIDKVIVVGHSMGGMLATRFALLFPEITEKLVLENPIGLEDYRMFVLYQPLEKIYAKERSATYESYKKYQQTYYPAWKPEYEQYVKAQAEQLSDPAFDKIAWVNAITYQMIYEQPVIHEFEKILIPTLLIIGQEDRTVVGKDLLTAEQKPMYGNYPELGKNAYNRIINAKLAAMPGIGHIPHIQHPQGFLKALFDFL